MPTSPKITFIMLAMIMLFSVCYASAKTDIHTYNFKKHLLTFDEFKDCPEKDLRISVSYAHLKGDKTEQAIVQGSSCNTGTAGPDIHSVYEMGLDGKIHELTVPTADRKYDSVLFGNANYELSSKEGKLVATFNDTSERENPLVIQYVWKKNAFNIISVVAAPVYKTSYDCNKAQDLHDKAICAVKELADLDLRLADLTKEKLVAEQKAWIVSRNKECVIYKWWVDCLKKAYTDRINVLSKK